MNWRRWLTDEKIVRLEPYLAKSHAKTRVEDRRVLSGIIFVNRNRRRWRDASKEHVPTGRCMTGGGARVGWAFSSG
ncbi:MAG: hypothetical protein P0Y64_12680 [Candidatus Sphingomonas colombiensis]|nr:hypothetical protein [Sphingomonas sp.]WEK42247.1 MAG: hypothetical protein P0Y64_12680 [Sphingomonas sp.]